MPKACHQKEGNATETQAESGKQQLTITEPEERLLVAEWVVESHQSVDDDCQAEGPLRPHRLILTNLVQDLLF